MGTNRLNCNNDQRAGSKTKTKEAQHLPKEKEAAVLVLWKLFTQATGDHCHFVSSRYRCLKYFVTFSLPLTRTGERGGHWLRSNWTKWCTCIRRGPRDKPQFRSSERQHLGQQGMMSEYRPLAGVKGRTVALSCSALHVPRDGHVTKNNASDWSISAGKIWWPGGAQRSTVIRRMSTSEPLS